MARQAGSSYITVGGSRKAMSLGGILLCETLGSPSATGLVSLRSYTLPANALNVNGRALRIRLVGTTANNANSKTFVVSFGGVNLLNFSTVVAATIVDFDCYVYRTGTATQTAIARLATGASGASLTPTVTVSSPTANLGADATLLLAVNAATTATDIVVPGYTVELLTEGSPE